MFIFLGLLLIISACTEDGPEDVQAPPAEEPYPEQPEEVIKIYQAHVDSNRFEQAKRFSTAAGQAWLDTLSNVILGSGAEMDSTLLQTRFLKIDCQVRQDTAICNCLATDQDGPYEVLYQLVRQEGRWKVEAPDNDDLFIDEQLIQDMIQQFIQE